MRIPEVILYDLPTDIKGILVKTFDDGEDYYTIMINSRLGYEEQINTYKHEIEHLRQRDFDMFDMSVDRIEYERHRAT